MAKGKANVSSSGASMSKYDVEVEARLKALEAQAHPDRCNDASDGDLAERVSIIEAVLRKDPRLAFDKAAAQDPELSISLKDDPASIGRRTNFATVYLLKKEDGSLDKIILPIHGYGLWSTLYGFIALEKNGNDIFGLQFYQHAETPGLGAEVDNPKWKAQWKGKKLNDQKGDLMIQVAKTKKYENHHIDALAGATLTSMV